MTIKELLQSKITTAKELENNCSLERTIKDLDMERFKGCPNCSDTCNQTKMPTEPWRGVIVCHRCATVSLIHYSDRMSGCHTDIVEVYKDK